MLHLFWLRYIASIDLLTFICFKNLQQFTCMASSRCSMVDGGEIPWKELRVELAYSIQRSILPISWSSCRQFCCRHIGQRLPDGLRDRDLSFADVGSNPDEEDIFSWLQWYNQCFGCWHNFFKLELLFDFFIDNIWKEKTLTQIRVWLNVNRKHYIWLEAQFRFEIILALEKKMSFMNFR